MKNLLVATDMSDRSDIAVARAISLSKTLPAEVTVLYVIEADLPDGVASALSETAEPLLRKRVAELSDKGDVDVAIRVDRGRDWAQIIEVAQKGSFDLIVMGAHRPTSREMTRGSTIDRVVRESGLPVLIAKGVRDEGYRHILAAVDFSLPSRQAAELAASLSISAKLRLIHVYKEPLAGMFGAESEEDQVNRLEHMLVGEAPAMDEEFPELVVKQGEPVKVLYDEVHDWPADLLVLGTHGRTGVGLAMLGSVAEQFVASPPCDILIVKAW